MTPGKHVYPPPRGGRARVGVVKSLAGRPFSENIPLPPALSRQWRGK